MGFAEDVVTYRQEIRDSLPPDSNDGCLTYEEWRTVYAFVLATGVDLGRRMNKALFREYNRAFEILERKRLRYPENQHLPED